MGIQWMVHWWGGLVRCGPILGAKSGLNLEAKTKFTFLKN
jgi:hypothetical protein